MAHSRVARRLGRMLEEARQAAGKTRDDVGAARSLPSKTTLQRLEGGTGRITLGTVLALTRFYGVSREQEDLIVELVEVACSSDWIDSFPDISAQLGWYVDLERDVTSLSVYHPGVVHGLLQTEDYAFAIERLATNLDDKAIASHVALKLRRQALISADSGVNVSFIMDETALRMLVSSDDVMTQQIEHLRELGNRLPILIRPFKAGPHVDSSLGGFAILDFPDVDQDPAMVATETLAGTRLREDPNVVDTFRKKYADLTPAAVPIKEFTL